MVPPPLQSRPTRNALDARGDDASPTVSIPAPILVIHWHHCEFPWLTDRQTDRLRGRHANLRHGPARCQRPSSSSKGLDLTLDPSQQNCRTS